MLQLAERCELSEIHAMRAKRMRYPYHVNDLTDNAPAYQQMHFGRNIATMLATAPDLHKRINDLKDAYALKGKAMRQAVHPDTMCSRYECIPGNEWLARHQHDEYPEPTLDITVDGQSFSVSGNYKHGMVKDFMGHYCRPGEGKIRIRGI